MKIRLAYCNQTSNDVDKSCWSFLVYSGCTQATSLTSHYITNPGVCTVFICSSGFWLAAVFRTFFFLCVAKFETLRRIVILRITPLCKFVAETTRMNVSELVLHFPSFTAEKTVFFFSHTAHTLQLWNRFLKFGLVTSPLPAVGPTWLLAKGSARLGTTARNMAS